MMLFRRKADSALFPSDSENFTSLKAAREKTNIVQWMHLTQW